MRVRVLAEAVDEWDREGRLDPGIVRAHQHAAIFQVMAGMAFQRTRPGSLATRPSRTLADKD